METVIRVAIIYVFIVVGLRVLGKREFSQLSPLELITLMLIPEIVSQALMREDFSITNALIGLTTLFILVFITSVLMHRFKSIEVAIADTPAILVQNGRFIEENLNKERVTPDEILTEIHKNGLEKLEQVKWAILETDGKISIVPLDAKYQYEGKHSKEKDLSG